MRKYLMSLIVSSSVALTLSVVADDAHHPPEGATSPSTETVIKQKQTAVVETGRQTSTNADVPKRMMQNADTLQQQARRMAETTDPTARARLVQEHLALLQEQTGMAKEMAGQSTTSMSGGRMPMEMCKEMMHHKTDGSSH